MNTAEFLLIASSIAPERDATVFEGKRTTYQELSDRVSRLAGAFTSLGVNRGDRIAILQVNCPQYVETYFAAAKIGAIFVPLNFRAKTEEVDYLITNAKAKVVLVGNRYLEMVQRILPSLPDVRHVIAIDAPQEGLLFYEDLLARAVPVEDIAEVEDDDITILMYTAGTTGRPKGVPQSFTAFVTYILENVEPASPDIEERNLLTVPLYHVAGMQAVLAAIYGGRTLVMMRQFEVTQWLETVHKEGATRAMLVPTMLKWVIDHPDFAKYDLSRLMVITYGAAPMPFEVIKKAIELMPWVNFINAFGQTETASTIASLGPEDHKITGSPAEREKKLKRLTSSIGKPLPDVEVKIAGEDGQTLPAGQVGEILVRGPRIMKGYWQDQEKSAQVLTKDGWLHTGDLGYLDEEGYIYLEGRGDDVIIRGGENISPQEVEDALYAHPKVEEAAVIGVPDPEWGQELRAIVALKKGQKATAEEIIEHCHSRLASFKRPRSVVFVDALPHSSVGKLLRRELRDKYGKP